MARMPSLPRPAFRMLLAAAMALAVLVAFCALALAQGNQVIEITIVTPDGDRRDITTGDISDPEIDTTYKVRQRNGVTKDVVVTNGIAVYQLLKARNAELRYSTLEFARSTGGKVVLTKQQIDNQIPPPVIYWDEATSAFWFLRAPKSSGDVNAPDHFKIEQALMFKQSPANLDVGLKADKQRIEPGESVKFTASVKGGPAGASYRYDWNFDDGKSVSDGGSRQPHTFERRGTYHVLVTARVRGEGDSDPAPIVKIQVGDPRKSDKNRDGGGTNATGTADSGAATGDSGAGATYGGSSSTTTPSVTPPPTSPPTPTPDPLVPDIATSGSTVEGNLLADASDPPATSILESAAKAARDGQRKEDDGPDGADVPEAALSIAGVLALLGLGAGMELREGRRPRLRLPRRAA
jgi:plastocyanin